MGSPGSRDPGHGREEADEGGPPDPAEQSALRRWFGSLSRGVQWLVAAVVAVGGVATAIGAIVALWPDPEPELGAKLSQVRIDRPVTLHEYELRHGNETAGAPGSPPALLLAADVVAQAAPDEETAPDESVPDESVPDESVPDESVPDESVPDESVPDDTAPDEDGAEGEEDIVREWQPIPEDRARLNEGLDMALSDEDAPELDLGPVCSEDLSDPDCGLRSTLTYLLSAHSEVSAAIVAERLAELFEGVRTSGADQAEPVGVTVNFNVSLTGFRGDSADVRFSLYAEGGGRVPRDWLENQRVLSIEAEAQKDSGSGEFWVPLPRLQGPYFVRFGVDDEDGERLDYWDTDPPFP
jgi:hypothetical protein